MIKFFITSNDVKKYLIQDKNSKILNKNILIQKYFEKYKIEKSYIYQNLNIFFFKYLLNMFIQCNTNILLVN